MADNLEERIKDMQKRAEKIKRPVQVFWLVAIAVFIFSAIAIIVAIILGDWRGILFFIPLAVIGYVLYVGVISTPSMKWHVAEILGMYFCTWEQGIHFAPPGSKVRAVSKGEIPVPVFIKGEKIELVDKTYILVKITPTVIFENPLIPVYAVPASGDETGMQRFYSLLQQRLQAKIQRYFTEEGITSDTVKEYAKHDIAGKIRGWIDDDDDLSKWNIRVQSAPIADIDLSPEAEATRQSFYDAEKEKEIEKIRRETAKHKGAQKGLEIQNSIMRVAAMLAGFSEREPSEEEIGLVIAKIPEAKKTVLEVMGMEAVKPTDKTIIMPDGGSTGKIIAGEAILREEIRESLNQ